MDYIVGAISLASLVLNYVLYRRVTARYPIGYVEELQFTPISCCCKSDVELLELKGEAPNPPPVTAPMVQEVYSGWKNEKGIPWVYPTKTPDPIINTPNRGPLARPDGFV